MTLVQALQLSPKKKENDYQESRNQLPPSPQITPTATQASRGFGGDGVASPSMDPLRSHRIPEPLSKDVGSFAIYAGI